MTAKKERPLDEYPTANDVFFVENVLDNWYDSAIKITELTKKLPKEITEDKLKQIVYYLEKTNKVLVNREKNQLIYIANPSQKLCSAIKKGIKYE
ncbi:MAG: hypothetical protein WCX73_00820 [Candidatus Pacearchaeota archaeon]|jgi:hypothetical protein